MSTVSTQTRIDDDSQDVKVPQTKDTTTNVSGTSSTLKKTVLHQQLYGSKRCLRRQSHNQQDIQHRELPYSGINHGDDILSYPLQRGGHCLYQHSQSGASSGQMPPLRQSESYATLPSAVACGGHGTVNSYPPRWCFNPNQSYCCMFEAQRGPPPQCTCGPTPFRQQDLQQQQQQHHQRQQQQPQQLVCKHLPVLPHTFGPNNPKLLSNGLYFGYENASHLTDEEDSAFPGLPERELNLLHCNVPALRRTGVDTTGMRQYFYPDGGWGWIICGLSFLAHLLTTGLQLSFGLLMIFIVQHLHQPSVSTEWLGALSWSISMVVAPFVVALCRKKSTRLLAVIGGLMLPLSILFTSFATELEQIVFSYGFIFGIGASMVRESSAMMLGNYFKRRRNFVEMVAMSGEGVGIALFSVMLKEGVGKAGWRLGLQIIAAFLSLSFFMALFYRPASLYHPQRRAIQHLKNQRKKMREDKLKRSGSDVKSRRFLLDMSPLKSANVKILVMTSGVAAFGIYAPMFTISLSAEKEESDIQDLVLLQAFLGISTTLGVVLAGMLVRHPFRIKSVTVTSQVVSQVFISVIAIAILFLSFVMGYQGLCVLSWIYGIGFGGFRYSLKILALERVKLKQFSKAWGLIRGIESVPVLVSVPLTTFLNDYSLKYGRAGYYICSAAAAIAGIIIFFINHSSPQPSGSGSQANTSRRYENGLISTLLPPPPPIKLNPRYNPNFNFDNTEYGFHGPNAQSGLLLSRSCISLNNIEPNHYPLRALSPVCCRFQLECFRNASHNQIGETFNRNNLRRRTIESDIRRPFYGPQYITGRGSIGSQMGKRIQNDLRNHCSNLHSPYNLCATQDQSFPMRSFCTCSSVYHPQNCRSLSVPEGLSSISQQCLCRTPLHASRREQQYQYVRHSPAIHRCDHHHHHHGSQFPQTPTIRRSCHLQRSESLTKPLHYVEQMTTSV